jgi:alpha-L-fucosidase
MKKIFLLLLIAFSLINSQQELRIKNLVSSIQHHNFVIIIQSDTEKEILSKAANIVPTPQQYNWQKMEFIAFAHFGMNTFSNREWGEGKEDPKLFNPTNFDARQWVRVLKSAGIKMLILTAKHHDGFCLWPSKFTEHSVKNSPWKNGNGDVVREVSNACKEFDLKFGVYLSPWDRNNPDYGDSPKYNEYFKNQLRELLTNYGEVSEVWFDGANGEGPNGKKQVYDFPSYYKVVRELQPDAVIFGMAPDVRWVGTESGYGRETEWSVIPIDLSKLNEQIISTSKNPLDEIYQPKDIMGDDLGSPEKIFKANGLFWYPAETDVSIRPGWFYHPKEDSLVKSPEKLVDIYFSSVGKNGVLLLNIPPDKNGLISKFDEGVLKGMKKILGKTFKTNYASKAKIKSSNMKKTFNASLLGGNTYWTTTNNIDSAELEFILPSEKIFDVAMLQEEIRVGQRIEKFHLEYWNGKEWKKIIEGTTVGYKRLLRFDPVKTNRVKLVIEKSRLNPTIANFGLYKLSK